MKSGAGDDPFADDSPLDESDEMPDGNDAPADDEKPSQSSTAEERETTPRPQTQTQTLPYKYRRDSVKQGRNQQPVFLQSATEELIEETMDSVEDRFDEAIYKTDVVEAMLVAGGEGTTPEAVLQRWGYGMKNR
ncbi:hypothetical protein EI982_03280 [Haloplanus rallus]|jgi:hypothetical protein|uniref:Uncharacterized protein n=1 Tax=Haloplanus rallus TaxID=1816183 RepID=A0A6B9F6A3_9EURY|nr:MULTISPECIES: hypothetical protein [Haloplanus]QGX93874.1 hypothetical protein EI982_03280 [Haloplanus rallus]